MSESEDGRVPSHRVWRQPIGWGEGRDDEMQARPLAGGGGGRDIPGPSRLTLVCLP